MAFSAREIRLVLSIQSYGTGQIGRLRRDMMGLAASTRAINAEQLAVQGQMLGLAEKTTRTRDRIARAEMSQARAQTAVEERMMQSQAAFADRRQRLAMRAMALDNTVASRRMQTLRIEDRIASMRGSGTTRLAVREQQLAAQKIRMQNEIARASKGGPNDLGLQSRVLSNQAAQLGAARRMKAELGAGAANAYMQGKNIGNAGERTKELVYRYRAAVKSGEQLAAEQKQLTRELKGYEAQLKTILTQEQLLSQQKTEQAAAIGRQEELLSVQAGYMKQLETQQATVRAQIEGIDVEEARVNQKLAEQLALLKQEDVELTRQKVLLGEQVAEMERLGSLRMKQAVAADAAFVKQQRLMNLETRARGAAHVGRTAQFAGLLGTAGFAMAAQSAANFNQQLALAATQTRSLNGGVQETAKNMDLLQNGIHNSSTNLAGVLELMSKYPASAEEMTKATYDIYSSMSVSLPQGLKLLESFNQLAVATGTDLPTATNAAITVLNNFRGAGASVNKTLNLMVATVRFGRMRLSDFNSMLSKVAPAAAATGQRFQDVAGAMALITRLQPSQAMGATGIARLLQVFSDPGFQRGTAKFGVDITRGVGAVGKLKPLPVIINEMAYGFRNIAKFGGPQELFRMLTALGDNVKRGRMSTIQAQRAYVFLINHVKEYDALQNKTVGDTTEFMKSLAFQMKQPGVQWQVFLNSMRAFVITVGAAALPVLLSFAQHLQNLTHWFQNLNKHTRDSVIKWGVLASVFLLVGGTVLNIAASFAALTTNLRLMRIQMILAGTAAEETGGKAAIGASGWLLLSRNIGIALLAYVAFKKAMNIEQGKVIAFGGVPVPQGTSPRVQKAYAAYLKSFTDTQKKAQGSLGSFLTRQEFKLPGFLRFHALGREQIKGFQTFLKEHPKLLAQQEAYEKKHHDKSSSIYDQYVKNYKRIQAKEYQNQKDQIKNLLKLYNQGTQDQSRTQSIRKQLAEAHVQAVKDALEKERQAVKSTVDNLMSIYDNFRQQNTQALGGIFQGPVMGGMLGQVFTQLNDSLREFGVQIPIPFNILKRDMDQSLKYAKRWFADIAKLRKAGAPEDVVQAIEQMGPEAGIAIIEGMLSHGGKAAKALAETWHKALGKGGIVQTQTKKDMDATLAYWKTFGNNVALQMAKGIIDNPYDAAIRKNFTAYVKNTFGAAFKKQFAKDVAQAMADARKRIAAENPVTDTGGGGGGGGGGRGGAKPRSAAQIALERERRSIRRQLIEHQMHSAGHRGTSVTIHYHGDTVTVKADGATVASVMRALNKKRQRTKNKVRFVHGN